MATGLTSGLGIAGIIFIIIGIIMAVIGIVLLIARQSTTTEWYIWLLLVGGIILGVIGGIMLALALAWAPVVPIVPLTSPCAPLLAPAPVVDPCGAPMRYIAPQPVPTVQYAPQQVVAPQQYVQQPVAAPQQYVQYAQQSLAPTSPPRRVISQQVQEVGPGQFDPDPEVSVVETRPAAQRVTAVGPYGPNGEQRTVTGVYQPPAQHIYTTADITGHSVVNNGVGLGGIPAPVMYRTMQ